MSECFRGTWHARPLPWASQPRSQLTPEHLVALEAAWGGGQHPCPTPPPHNSCQAPPLLGPLPPSVCLGPVPPLFCLAVSPTALARNLPAAAQSRGWAGGCFTRLWWVLRRSPCLPHTSRREATQARWPHSSGDSQISSVHMPQGQLRPQPAYRPGPYTHTGDSQVPGSRVPCPP